MTYTVVSFIGTQDGMSFRQHCAWIRFLTLHTRQGTEVHHGDCTGADAEAHQAAIEVGGVVIHSHPGYPPKHPKDKSRRAFCDADVVHEAKSFMDRNDDLVEVGQVIVAAPKQMTPVLRSGTWSTIRRAKKLGKRVIILPR